MTTDNNITYDTELTPEEKQEVQEALKSLSDEEVKADEDFIKNVYGQADNNMSEVYTENKKNKESILDKISKVLLYYTIVDSVLKLSNREYKSLFSSFSKTITDMFRGHTKLVENTTEDTLNKAFETISDKYNLKHSQKQREKLVNQKYFGKHFSERIWTDEQKVSKEIQLEMKNFLKGKVNANQIAKKIQLKFDSNEYNTKRLVDTELARIQNELFRQNCKKTGAKYVLYKATFCRTCKTCREHHNITYKIDNAPLIPVHPNCHCYYTIVDILKPKIIRQSGAQSGALNDTNDPKWEKRNEHAKNYYNQIKNSKAEPFINALVKNTQFDKGFITKVYNHVFINKHYLDAGYEQFAPDYDMSESFRRLRDGKDIKEHDITMLKHEHLEAGLEKRYNLIYREAHDLTDRKYNYSKELDAFHRKER